MSGYRWLLVIVVLAGIATIMLASGGVWAQGSTASSFTPEDSFFTNLFKIYTPRRLCMLQETPLIWLHLISDTLIALAYYSIPLALVYFVHRRHDLAFNWMFVCFAVFILACGTTHIMGVLALWWPAYRVDGIIKLLTAVVSVGTAVLLWPLIPRALALPSPAQLREANAGLQRMRNELESRVTQRTEELQAANERLREQMEARKDFQITQARLAALVESSDDAIIGKSLDGVITTWNQGAERLFGYSPEQIIGKPIFTIVPAERKQEEAQILQKMKHGERVQHFETVRRRKDGRDIDVSLSASPIRADQGEIIGASTIARDITQQKNAQRERDALLAAERAARSDAEHANRVKDEFLANLSHELRTPLNAILGWATLLRREGRPEEELCEGLNVIERNTRVQVQLIEDLLDMSRIVSGRLRLDVQSVDLAEVIQAALETVRPSAEAKRIRLQPVLDPLAGPVTGDPARLQQVVWNLLANAIKFTDRGGRVQVFLERVNSHLEITVTDTGRGIAPELLPYVFDRFRQGDGGAARAHGGLGLGLSIVRHVVEMHGGQVRAKSAGEGQGASFIVTLPLRVARREDPQLNIHPTASPQTNPAELPRLDDVKVLVVDDEPDARELAAKILTERGATVVTAGSANEGIELLRSERPSVLISDIGMPTEDGYAFIRRVRRLTSGERGDTPAVALTAFARSEDRQHALLSGFQLHLAKPVERSELVIVVANLAGKVVVA